ncbi:class I SAM-dependent methyltransferase [Cryomorphaceae bacterium]|nr:class I SAM-dependent methyltransferase [Cryomorphaceae bacterium]
MRLEDIAQNISPSESGIYEARSASAISYPDEGNQRCMQVEEHSFWFKHRNNVISANVAHFSPSATFFDIGGGNGFVAKRLQDDGRSVVLVEPGPSGAKNAHDRGVEQVLCSTLEDAEFLPAQMESAGLFDVVEHIEDDAAFLRNIHTYLKPGGLVYLTVPTYRWLWSNEDDIAGHYTRYTRKRMNKLLRGLGYDIAFSTYFFSLLPLPILIFRSLPSRLGIRPKEKNMETTQNEHSGKSGFLVKLAQKLWDWELNRLSRQRSIGFGGSLFVVARKRD